MMVCYLLVWCVICCLFNVGSVVLLVMVYIIMLLWFVIGNCLYYYGTAVCHW